MAKRTFPALFLAIAMIASLLPGLSLAETARITDKDVTLTLVRSDNSNQPMKTDSLVLDELYKRTGVKLSVEAIPGSDFATKTKTLIATNSMPDILYDTYDVADFAGTGVFLPISEYLDVMPNLSALFEAQPDLKKLYIEGVLYTIPVLGRNVYRMGRSPMIREDLLAETGLPMPTTFDELTEVLRAIKANHPDIYPVANRNGTTNLFTCYAYAMGLGSGVYWEPAQNAYVYAQIQPGFATGIRKAFWIRTTRYPPAPSGRKSSPPAVPPSSLTIPPSRPTSTRRWPWTMRRRLLCPWKSPPMAIPSAASIT